MPIKIVGITKGISILWESFEHGITLLLEVNGIPDVIMADKRKLKQYIYNLLPNAAKFTPAGGEILLQASNVKGEFVEISVRDTGIGIKPENMELIFHPFEQGESTMTRIRQGTGLGLSLSKSLVELHGGEQLSRCRGVSKRL